jgi:hypothetical protein
MRYINDDFKKDNIHRSGWKDTINLLKNEHGYYNILVDVYLDATFHWRTDLLECLKKDWMGFIHHTPTGNNNSKDLVTKIDFVNCKGLFVLSYDLKQRLLEINPNLPPIHVLMHPTETPEQLFSIGKYVSNKEKKLIHIGNWMRDPDEFSKVRTALIKYDLNDNMEFLPNSDYDTLLSNNLVCIFLKDASAINTVIECIVRNTPIVVNPLPAVVEYLGEKYPLYANDSLEASSKLNNMTLILSAYTYLCNMNKTKFTFNYFNDSFNQVMLSNGYHKVDPPLITTYPLSNGTQGTQGTQGTDTFQSLSFRIPVTTGRGVGRSKPIEVNKRRPPFDNGHDFYD